MNILGISSFYHDSAAALVRDGELIAAAHEERFTRERHDRDFPINAIKYCLKEGKIDVSELDYIGFYDRPFIKFERLLFTYLHFFPRGFSSFVKAIPRWIKEQLFIRSLIREQLKYEGEILFADHHLSHAASAFLVSPFKESAILTVDGVGEWSTATKGVGRDTDIQILKEIRFPHSLGLLYSAFTYYLGFKVNSAEYKVMGLAPYGEPVYYDKLLKLIEIHDDGSFVMNMDYFEYPYGLTMTNKKFHKLFGGAPLKPETKPTKREHDLAASIQKVTDEIMFKMAMSLYKETGLKKLCLAGGVALNCVANGKILRETPFDELFIQPAAGDAGGALGIAFYIYNTILKNPRSFVMKHSFWGPQFEENEIKKVLDKFGASYKRFEREELLKTTARLINEQNVIGWFQGRMEYGPRALGSRSILADPRDPKMRDVLNMKIKFREAFRPFAPSVLLDKTQDYFDISTPSPFMLLICQVKENRRVIPAVTHVDGSARIQTVDQETAPLYYDLISEFEKLTGLSVIINTSFNVRGEPIVCTPQDAYLCFMRTKMDYLMIGPFLLDKKQQPPLKEDIDWRKKFALD